MCKGVTRIFDHVDGVMLTERESDDPMIPPYPPDIIERFISKYTWGPLGPISREGVRIDGNPPYEMCLYIYLIPLQERDDQGFRLSGPIMAGADQGLEQ